MKTLTSVLAALASFVLSAPSSLGQAAGMALYLLAVDTAGGLWLARRTGNMTSSVYRGKLKDKLACYGMILALCAAVGVLAQSWAWPVAGFWALCAGEGISIGETLRSGLELSKAPWTKPVSDLLGRLMGTFAKEGEASGDDQQAEKDTASAASSDTAAGA